MRDNSRNFLLMHMCGLSYKYSSHSVQARIRVLGLEGAKFGEGSEDHLGSQRVQGGALVHVGGPGGWSSREATAFGRFEDQFSGLQSMLNVLWPDILGVLPTIGHF